MMIRDVPDDIARTMKIRAAQEGKSLQGYLLDLVTREASVPTMAEITARIRPHATMNLPREDMLDIIDAGRERRSS